MYKQNKNEIGCRNDHIVILSTANHPCRLRHGFLHIEMTLGGRNMQVVTVEKREASEKAKHLRKAGWVPGNVFGGPVKEAVSVKIAEKDADKIVKNLREGSRLILNLDGVKQHVQIKEIDSNAVKNEILNISFQALQADQKVNSIINIFFTNIEKIHSVMDEELIEIPYAALPADMIDTITIDMANVQPGTSITVADIPELQTDKIELLVDPDSLVVKVNELVAIPDEEEAEA